MSEQKEKKIKKEKSAENYSVPMYVIIMFAVVAVLILLSYFISQRSTNRTIADLSSAHTQIQTKALDSIEQLQEENRALNEKTAADAVTIEELESRVEALEQALEKKEAALEEQITVKAELEQKLAEEKNRVLAAGYFRDLFMAVDSGDKSAENMAVYKLDSVKDFLDDAAAEWYAAYLESKK